MKTLEQHQKDKWSLLNMKQYTIVYGDWFMVGSNRNSITKYDKVETDNLKDLLDDDKYFGNLWFVFDGWCNETND
jgi:hypothetical protein